MYLYDLEVREDINAGIISISSFFFVFVLFVWGLVQPEGGPS